MGRASVKRYFIGKVRLADYDDGPDAEDYLSRTIYVPDETPYETGILDAQGNMILAQVRIDPIGFTTEFVRTDE
jgi:hypothetical protein